MLGRALDNPVRPFAAIMGGAKVSDKIAVLENLAGRVDVLIIGGGMAATFLRAQGNGIGDSLVEDDRVAFAGNFMETALNKRLKLLLPTDVVIANAFSESADHRTVPVSAIPDGWRVMDIGPDSANAFAEALRDCKTVVWNGPMGVFEWENFTHGTRTVADAVASLADATTVVGGGSTAEVVDSLGIADRITHVSTGGGASLEFLEGRELPGVAALLDKN
jgi:3-phosphoglycerate kinase